MTLYARPSAPWFDMECHLTKVKTRKLERSYRSCPSQRSRKEWQQQFEHQRQLFQVKAASYWSSAIDMCGNDAKAMWRKLRCLLQPMPDTVQRHTADQFAQQFSNKVDMIRRSTATAPTPNIRHRDVDVPLCEFELVTAEEIVSILRHLPTKHCTIDPIPTWLVKQLGHVLAPVLATLCNASFDRCLLPVSQKRASMRPLLKKPTLDANDLSSYRPILNLSFVSKTIERVVDSRLTRHADLHSLLPTNQSAYRSKHSTETAVVSVHNELVYAVDSGHVGALVMLDLSSAFDTVDHDVMFSVLSARFGIHDKALEWLHSYFSYRSQVVSVGESISTAQLLTCGVPQGSVLGPKTFVMYTEDGTDVFHSHRIFYHLYADDMQMIEHCILSEAKAIVTSIQNCVSDVCGWCSSRQLQLNSSKTNYVVWLRQ